MTVRLKYWNKVAPDGRNEEGRGRLRDAVLSYLRGMRPDGNGWFEPLPERRLAMLAACPPGAGRVRAKNALVAAGIDPPPSERECRWVSKQIQLPTNPEWLISATMGLWDELQGWPYVCEHGTLFNGHSEPASYNDIAQVLEHDLMVVETTISRFLEQAGWVEVDDEFPPGNLPPGAWSNWAPGNDPASGCSPSGGCSAYDNDNQGWPIWGRGGQVGRVKSCGE